MCVYNIPKEDLIVYFKGFLQDQEGNVSAKVIAECWNELAKEEGWTDRLKSYEIKEKELQS